MAQVPAAPPTPQEVTRKLSMHASPKKSQRLAPAVPLSGTESESDVDVVFSPPETFANLAYFASPGQHGDRPLSSIIERRSGDAEREESDEDDDDFEPPARILDGQKNLNKNGELENVIKAGYLLKKGERRKTWKKRWFVLRPAHLAYYKTSAEYQLLRLLDLAEAHSCSPCSLKKHSHTFALVSPQRTYYLQANSDAEVQDWVRAVNGAREAFLATQTQSDISIPPPPSTAIPIPTPPSSRPPVASSLSKGFIVSSSPSDRRSGHALASSASDSDFDPATSPAIGTTMPAAVSDKALKGAVDPNKIVLQGYLMKCGSKRRNWRKRWFTLSGDRLMIRGSHMDTKHHREIDVSQILDALEVDLPLARHPGSPPVSSQPLPHASPSAFNGSISNPGGNEGPDAGQHGFKIVTAKRTLLLCAPSEEEEIKWLSAVRALIARRTTGTSTGISGPSSSLSPASTGAAASASPPQLPGGYVAPRTSGPSASGAGSSPLILGPNLGSGSPAENTAMSGMPASGSPSASEVLSGHVHTSSSSSAGKSMWRRRSLSNSTQMLAEEPDGQC